MSSIQIITKYKCHCYRPLENDTDNCRSCGKKITCKHCYSTKIKHRKDCVTVSIETKCPKVEEIKNKILDLLENSNYNRNEIFEHVEGSIKNINYALRFLKDKGLIETIPNLKDMRRVYYRRVL
jgi:hypothetical protein